MTNQGLAAAEERCGLPLSPDLMSDCAECGTSRGCYLHAIHAYIPSRYRCAAHPDVLEVYPAAEAASRERIEALEAERDEMQVLFDLQHARMGEATALWRAEAPEERAMILPDLGKLLAWLMKRAALAPAQQQEDE